MTDDGATRLRELLRRLVRYCQERGACDGCGSLWCPDCPIEETKEELRD